MFANTQMMGKDPKRPGRGGERNRAEEPADEEVTGGLATPGARAEASEPAAAFGAPGPNAMSLNFEEFKASGSSLLDDTDASSFTLDGKGTDVNVEEIELAIDSDHDDSGIAAELLLEDI